MAVKMTKALAKKAKSLAARRGITYHEAMGSLLRGGKSGGKRKSKPKKSRGRSAPRRSGRKTKGKAYRPLARGSRFSGRVKGNLVRRGIARRSGKGYALNPRRRRNSGYDPIYGMSAGAVAALPKPKKPRARRAKRVSLYTKSGKKIKTGVYAMVGTSGNKKLRKINPRRRRGRRSNPGGRRRSSRRRRSNPVSIKKSLGGIKSLFSVKGAMKILKPGAGALAGIAVAAMTPAAVRKYLPGAIGSNPIAQILGTAVATTVVSGLVRSLLGRRDGGISAAMATGGAGVVVLQIVGALSSRIPALRAIPLPSVGMAGLGAVVSASQLVDGEALYGPDMGDFLQLSGPVPEQLFAGGLNGLGDYAEFTGRAAGRAAELASAAQVDWTPGAETNF